MAVKNMKNISVLEFDTDAIKATQKAVAQETDDEILARLRERFTILTDMTKAVKSGDVRAMIVSGPPGVGKSFGVEEVLQKDGLFDTLGERKPRYEVVKGAMSALGLYAKLYEYSDAKNVLVFDDCDSILMEDLSLNILKGAAIFITNIKFEHVKSKRLRDHLDALESRCHYIDLQMDTDREKILRIKQIVGDGMLDAYEFEPIQRDEVVDFIVNNASKLRELSLRMVLKVADLRKAFPGSWMAMARTTCMRRT